VKLCRCGVFFEPPGKRGRCPSCARAYERERRRQRGSTTERGLGATHQRLRKQVLVEERFCWICGEPTRAGDPLEVDHVVPRSRGGKTERPNLRAAHASCNRRRGAGVERQGSALTRNPAFRETNWSGDGPLVG
jgi:5-methylcytosine-specific restriction endonuclease McrA